MSDADPLPSSARVLHAALAGFSAVLVGNGLGRFAYTRSVRVCFLSKGGYVDLAKRYRELCDRKQLEFDSFDKFCEHAFRSEVPSPPDLVGISVLFSTAHRSTLRVSRRCAAKR